MPRPLRSRVTSSRTTAPVTAPPPTTQTRSSSAEHEEVSGRKTTRARKAKDLSMMKDSLLERARGNADPQAAEALEASKRRRDEALGRLENLTSTTSGGDNSEEAVSPAVEVGRKEQAATATRQRRAPDASGLDVLDDEMFGGLDTSFEDEDSADPHHTTDTSTFNIAVFKRRPRQSSIVGRDDAPIRPSSRGPNTPGLSSTFSLGTFKRRAREPSILLSSAHKESTNQSTTRPADDTSEDDEEDFAPEAEGTPARPSRGRASEASSIHSRKRKSTDLGENETKRQAVEQEQDDDEVHESIEVDDQSSLSSLALDRDRFATPVNEDEIMAPPASSGSSNASPTVWPPLRTLRRGRSKRPASRSRKTPTLDDALSDMSSPPSLTHSPNFPARKTRKGKAASKREPTPNLNTADLASLLPRRYQRAQSDDPFDMGSSGDENDGVANGDDELSYVGSRRSRRPVRPLGGAAATNQSNPRQKAKEAPASGKRAKRTYGSRNLSDKENQAEGESIVVGEPTDDTFFDDSEPTGSVPPISEELKTQGKRFKEVDKWSLDYEEVVESSSPVPEVIPDEQPVA